jgi:hypothetical protein
MVLTFFTDLSTTIKLEKVFRSLSLVVGWVPWSITIIVAPLGSERGRGVRVYEGLVTGGNKER